MIKFYASLFTRNFLFVFTLILFFVLESTAQTPAFFKGLGTSSNTIPMNTAGSHTQQIYLPGDFNAVPNSGLITKIYFRNSIAGSSGTYSNFSVAFLQNSMAAFPDNTFLTGFTTALSAASITINGNPTAGGWYEIPLTTPFLYNNSQTLIVEIKYTSRTGGMSGYTTSAVGNKRLSIITAPGPTTGNLSTLWGDFGMDLGPSGPCVNPPDPGTVTSSAANSCLGVPFTLTTSGGTSGSGQTYQWQISPNNISWTDIPGATNASLTTSQTSTNYYRLVVTCGVSVNSNSVQVSTATAVSGTFTINSALPTGGTNFQTFNAAYDFIKCGIDGPVIFNVDPLSGPYNEQLNMIPVPGASATNTVTFNGNGRTISFLSTNSNERAVIKLNGADHIKFDNLVITALGTATTEYGFGVQLLNDADSNAVTNSVININTSSTSTNYAGIVMSAAATSATTTGNTLSDGNVFSGNTITGGYYGITCVGSTSAANRDNIFSGNDIKDFYFYGIYILGNFNTRIDSNTISRPVRTVVTTCNAIYMSSLNVSVNITRNTITNPFGGAPASTALFNGIFITGVDALSGLENKVINNQVYNITGAGEANGINNTGSDNVWYQHNTILMDGTSGTAITRGFYQTTLAAGIRFENNIVVIARTGTGAKYAVYHNTITSDIYSNFNDLYIAPVSTNAFTGFYTSAQATLADWRTASGDDLNSVATNPLFTNVATGNLRPTNASIDNLGDPVGVLIDITGLARSLTTPDLGAYEFTPGPCFAPPLAGDAVVNPVIVCVNTSVSLELTGNSTGLGQTYQWQSSATIGGPYTNIGTALTNPATTITASTTLYYRAAVTCSGITEFSTPVLLTVNPALPAGTYTINSTQPTGGTNYNSFNAAKDAMNCGVAGPVIFNVVPGTGPYNEQLILDSIAGTSAVNTVTFNGNGNTIAFSSSVTDERAVIKLRSTDHFIFDSLVINATGAGTYGYGVQLLSNADSNKINNCTILANTTATTTNFAGIVMSNSETLATTTGNSLCDGNVFSNNSITGGYYGITMVGGITTTTVPVMNNKATGNTIQDFYFYGIYLAGNANSLIEHNNISRPSRTTVSTCYGIYLTSAGSSNISISKNRIHNPFGGNAASTSVFGGVYITGADAPSGSENIVSNNLIYNVNGSGTQYGLYNSSSNNVKYYHNTISLQDDVYTGTALTYGFYQVTLAEGIDIKNNIFTVSRTSSGNKFGLFFSTATTTYTSNYNDLYITGTNAFTGYDGTNRVTLADWRAATSQDLNSLAVNPFYSSPVTGNFMPMSPVLDNKGTPVGITTDILDAPRSAVTPDIGAYEFEVPPCTAPPVAGTATANPTSGICMGESIDLALVGNSFGAGQTYQWQTATNAAGPWTNMGAVMMFPDTTIFATGSFFYRVLVTCGGNTQTSASAQVTLNPAFLAGTYTINKTIPASATNFTSFVSAVAALDCGITGPVFFDVNADTYTEQVRMKYVAGTSPTVRVTFRAANGDPSSVILTNNATVAANNYTLKLDSAQYITWKNMTIAATNASNGRVIELANTASFDSLVNLRINAPVSTATANTISGIYADLLRGSGNVIKDNIITNGSSGIYLEGTAIANLTYDNVIDSNTINNSYYYGIYVGFNGRATVSKNIVNVTMPRNATNYGIYSTNSDSAFQYVANKVNINGITATTTYGMYFTACTGSAAERGRIAGNTIMAVSGNTGTLYGMYQTTSNYVNTVNNVISINTTGATSYGSYSTASGGVNFHNNTIVSTATSATNNVAAYFAQTSGALPSINIQNNIFSHLGSGRAMYVTNLNFIYSDYNTFYTNGPTLIQWNAGNQYPTLQRWRDTSYWDLSSIAVQPALISPTDPRPDVANPDVWAIHGRGNQVPGNDYDFNNNPRPTTLTAGVPDMGAYEFLPTSLPTVLTGIPATPVAGGSQYFMYGTDTVARVKYKAGFAVPASATLQRYSGVLPPGLAAGQQSMYFYTDFTVPAQGAYNYDIEQFYVDSWQGFIPFERAIKLGRTNAANAWVVNLNSKVDEYQNVISDTALVYIDKFTGLTDGSVPPPPVVVYPIDSSNSGTRFWVGYGHHYSFSTNGQDMVLYLSAQAAATVEVKVNGTSYKRIYNIPANSAIVSIPLPKYGLIDSRITDEGKFDRGISIESDVPIQAYAHIYDGATSGASLLLPVGVYGYEYQSLNARQYYPTGGAGSYSWFMVIADRDSTLLEINPSVDTKGGRPAGVPFQVYLNRGEVYNVMGTINGATGTDLSGSTVKSVPNASGNCNPFAMFSGSSRTAICNTTNGDNLIQQVFPSQAWGTKYLTFATANSTSSTQYNSNIWRVMVKDVTTVVRRNGVVLDPTTLSMPGKYYEFSSPQGVGTNTTSFIESDKPVMVGQYMVSTGGTQCPGVTASGNGDPEMIYISPLEQGIKSAVFYNTNESAITSNYINVILPTAGLATLTIDGSSTFTDVFPHPNLPGYTCVRQNIAAAPGQHRVMSDSAFTSITYGLGSVESYGYNAGTLVKNLNGVPSFTNTLGTTATSSYTCVDAPLQLSISIPLKPTSILWRVSQVPGLSPNTDTLQTNPVPTDSTFSNGRWFYRYVLNVTYRFSSPGTYNVPIRISHPSIEGCSNTVETLLTIPVLPAPVADFTGNLNVCLGETVTLTGAGTTSNNIPITTYNWNFGDATTGIGQNQVKTYAAPGTYNVKLEVIAQDGCIGDTIKPVVVSELPTVAVVQDSLVVCGASSVTFEVLNPVAGTTYQWFTTPTGGTAVFTGTSYTIPNVIGTVIFYVEASNGANCISPQRIRVIATVLPDLVPPVVVVDSAGIDRITFRWAAVPGALSYEISINNGSTWQTPSSGPAGLTHTVTGLNPLSSVTLIVRALGQVSCQQSVSQPVTGKTLTDQIFIPNAFSPNGDGLNDVLLVYGYSIQSLRFMVFNQWGEKVFESYNQGTGWNGTYKGKPQPSGVYMYVCEMILRDGTKLLKKGSVNLVR